MRFRVGNLVKHKSGGPIMMIDLVLPEGAWLIDPDFQCWCVWIEGQARKGSVYRASHLQAVYADGSPRNYDDEVKS